MNQQLKNETKKISKDRLEQLKQDSRNKIYEYVPVMNNTSGVVKSKYEPQVIVERLLTLHEEAKKYYQKNTTNGDVGGGSGVDQDYVMTQLQKKHLFWATFFDDHKETIGYATSEKCCLDADGAEKFKNFLKTTKEGLSMSNKSTEEKNKYFAGKLFERSFNNINKSDDTK